MKKFIYILAVVGVVAACQPKDIAYEDLFKSEADLTQILNAEPNGYEIYDGRDAAHGLNQFVKDFCKSGEQGNFMSDESLYRTRSNATNHSYPDADGNDVSYLNDVYVFAIDTLPTNGKGIYIRGRISTDDYGGNFYKVLVIQQMVGGQQQALRLSVDAGNANGLYARGQEIVVRVNGLAIGRYANQPQLCVPSYNNNIYAGKSYAQKVGWAPGRIPAARFRKATTRIGDADPSKLVYQQLSIADFINTINLYDVREMDGWLVEIKNVYFTGQYSNYGELTACTTGDPEKDENANVFAPTTGNVGYPQSRVISDGTNNTLVSTSEYAKYARFYLPAAEYVGTVRGILGFYHDNNTVYTKKNGSTTYDSNAPSWAGWSITPCDLTQVLFDTQWQPEEYHK